jgi:hypothetical protein
MHGGAMNKHLLMDSLGWGLILWLIGYILGFVFFFFLPPAVLGWAILPIGLALTLWVLLTRVKGTFFQYYFVLAVVWTLIAVVFDYLFLVQLLKPQDGYYKLDVYLYYFLTFVSPLAVSLWKRR